MAKGATSPDLQKAFETHLQQTEGHIKRLDQIFEGMGVSSSGKKCKGMEGLIEEGAELLEEDGEGVVIDAGLIGAAQRVEHYEIAAYGTARALAETLGESQAARLLQQTLDEEGETDKLLTRLAEQNVNVQASEVSR
jgi:ferritin-like metal-binding protein YciE